MVKYIAPHGTGHFSLINTYGRAKATKDGRQRLRIAPVNEAGMLGADGQVVMGVTALPPIHYIQIGMAPKGPIERKIEILFNSEGGAEEGIV